MSLAEAIHAPPSSDGNPAAQLYDAVVRLARHRERRMAVHIHLSRLAPEHRRPQYLRAATQTFADHVRVFEGQTYQLAEGDIVFIARDAQVRDIDHGVIKLRHMFPDDPVAQIDARGREFATWFDLETDYEAFRAHAEALRNAEAIARRAAMAEAEAPSETPAPMAPLEPEMLAKCESMIARSDLSGLLRRQPICAVTPNGAPNPVLWERFFSVPDLQRTLVPGRDLRANPWLFRHFTETLDQRMLRAVANTGDIRGQSYLSLNLNIATVLTPAFLEFDEALPGAARGTVMLEFQVVDAFADLARFYFARDLATARGYRISLDGISHQSLAFVDRARLGIDFVKVQVDATAVDQIENGGLSGFGQSIRANDPSRVIFCHCETTGALELGARFGVGLYQGHHIDRLLRDAEPPRPPVRVRRAAAGR